MGLTLNSTHHWQLPDGGQLYSGESIEVLLNGSWVGGRIEYRPLRSYVLILENGQEMTISEDLEVRTTDRYQVT